MFGPRARPAPRRPPRDAVLRIEAELIVHLALLGVAQNVVGFLNVLEALLGGLVARIQIRDDICARACGKPCGYRPSGLRAARPAFRNSRAWEPYAHLGFTDSLPGGASALPTVACDLLRLLLVVDVDEFGVDDVISSAVSAPGPGRRRPGAGGRAVAGRRLADLYMASASLWLAVVSRSTAALISSGSFSA